MIKHPLESIMAMLNEQKDELGRARNAYLAKKAMKRNLEARLKQAAVGKSAAEKSMNADATDEWLHFEQDLARLEAIYEFQKDKFEVMEKEYQAQYLELKDNERMIRKAGA